MPVGDMDQRTLVLAVPVTAAVRFTVWPALRPMGLIRVPGGVSVTETHTVQVATVR